MASGVPGHTVLFFQLLLHWQVKRFSMEVLLLLLLPLVALVGFGGRDDEEPTDTDRTEDDQVIEGSAGRDTVGAGEGDDLIFGSSGRDNLDGGDGFDVLVGETWADTLSGGEGADVVLGGAGADSLDGGAGNDYVVGGSGDDLASGGEGDDVVTGMSGADTLNGGDGSDYVSGIDPRDLYDLEGIAIGSFDPAPILDDFVAGIAGLYGSDVSAGQLERVRAGFNSSDQNSDDDLLNGGAGDDLLEGDLSDTMTGGADIDQFNVISDGLDEAVTVTDFDPVAEFLRIFAPAGGLNVISVTDAADGTGSIVQLDGDTVALLLGVAAAQVQPGSIEVVVEG